MSRLMNVDLNTLHDTKITLNHIAVNAVHKLFLKTDFKKLLRNNNTNVNILLKCLISKVIGN